MVKEEETKKENKDMGELYKQVQEEQMRLHPELYDKNKSGGN